MKLVIANTDIHQDAEGRFSLNDLHKASGSASSQKPSEWVSNKQTQDLITEIEKAGIPALVSQHGGRAPGTFACKELVYAYAMWISPSFHLQVIRTFDAVATGSVRSVRAAIANPVPHVKAHMMAASWMQKFGVRPEMAAAVALKAIHDDTGLTTEGYRLALPGVEDVCNLNQKQLGELAGVSAREIGKRLRDGGLMEDDESGQRVVTEKGRKFGEMKPFTNNGHSGYEPRWRKEVIGVLVKKSNPARTELETKGA